jgi:hypothetical protein
MIIYIYIYMCVYILNSLSLLFATYRRLASVAVAIVLQENGSNVFECFLMFVPSLSW